MNRRVSVWKYVRLKNGRWRYCKPALAKNGKIRPDWVIVKGKAEHHPEGNFYVHRYDNGREIWRKIGESAQEAVDAASTLLKTSGRRPPPSCGGSNPAASASTRRSRVGGFRVIFFPVGRAGMLRFYPLHDAAKFILPDSDVVMALRHIEQTVRSMPLRSSYARCLNQDRSQS